MRFDHVVHGILTSVLVVAGCGDDGHRLIVEVRTDLTPGVDFVTVRAEVTGVAETAIVPAVIGQDFLTPVRVAEVDGLADGSYELVVTAYDATGAAVVGRSLRITLREDLAVTVSLSRSCQGLVCPAGDDPPSATTCAAGRCVAPECSELTPELCAPGTCSEASDCAAPIACGVGLCFEGGCFFGTDDSLCAIDQTCSATAGCVGGEPDAGVDAAVADAGPACATEVLLAQTDATPTSGGFSGTAPALVVVLGSDLLEVIGDDDPLPSGFSGVTDFRAADDAHFDQVVGPLMDGSETTASMAVTIAGAGGAFSPLSLSSSLVGTTITRVRRDVVSLTFSITGGRTDYDATVAWELWGCN